MTVADERGGLGDLGLLQEQDGPRATALTPLGQLIVDAMRLSDIVSADIEKLIAEAEGDI